MIRPVTEVWSIAVVRRASELQELSIAVTRGFWPPTIPKADAPADEPFGYRASCSGPPGSRRKDRRRLQASWAALGRVTQPDAETLVHLVTVLLGTVAWATGPSGLSVPDLGPAAAVEPRATAAHPRAYRGTKHKPPRARRADPLDLRPYLADPAQLRLVLQAFAPAFEGAREGLLASGVREDRIGVLGEAISAGVDPLIAYHVGRIRKRITSDLFRTHILPSCLGATAAEVTQALALHEQLRLDARPDLLAAVAALFAAAGARAAIRWGRRMVAEAEADQALFAAHLLETRAFEQDPAVIRPGDLETLRDLAPENAYRSWHYSLFRAVARGVPMDYLFTGFALARERDPRFDFGSVEPCFDFPDDTFVACLSEQERLQDRKKTDDDPSFWLRVWEYASARPGLGAITAKVPWDELGLSVARAYVKVFEQMRWSGSDEREEAANWEIVKAFAGPLLELILPTEPSFRLKAISYIQEPVWAWVSAEPLRRVLPRMLLVAQRLARAPFPAPPDATDELCGFLAYGTDRQFDAILDAPEASFRRFAATFAQRNDAGSVRVGLVKLMRSDGELLVQAFREQPAALFAAARALGAVSRPVASEVVRRLAAHPLSAPVVGPAALLQRLEEHGEAEGLPGKIRRLRPEDGDRLARAEPALRKRLLAARLARLERLAREALAGDLRADLDDKNAVHALEIMAEGEGNRRSLRRFLDAHFGGDTGYLARHPETRVWFARHPTIDERRWTEGIVTTGDIVPHGLIRIAMERDPLEALKLGTYVGSCLAPGGQCTYSAGCVVLDVNKQVLYARDARRTVVGRQLVAISREGELVCFAIYPRSASAALKALFRAHDVAFAAALGVPLHRETPDGKGYRIDLVIASEWWDDGVDDNALEGDSPGRSSADHKASR